MELRGYTWLEVLPMEFAKVISRKWTPGALNWRFLQMKTSKIMIPQDWIYV